MNDTGRGGGPCTHVNGHAVVEALADHGLALDVDVLPLLDGQRLHQLAVDVQGDVLGLDAQGDLVPVTVKEVVDPGTAEDHPDGILHGPHGVVLDRPVLAVQPDGDLGRTGPGFLELPGAERGGALQSGTNEPQPGPGCGPHQLAAGSPPCVSAALPPPSDGLDSASLAGPSEPCITRRGSTHTLFQGPRPTCLEGLAGNSNFLSFSFFFKLFFFLSSLKDIFFIAFREPGREREKHQ